MDISVIRIVKIIDIRTNPTEHTPLPLKAMHFQLKWS